MAYISKEDKKNLTPAIKAVLKKYNMKGTISVRHMSSLVVKISKGELDIIGASSRRVLKDTRYDRYDKYDVKKINHLLSRTYIDVNTYWIDESYDDPKVVAFLNELKEAMEGPEFFNHDDIMTDYAHRSHYVDILVGTFNKPYECTGEAETFEPVEVKVYEAA
jgi:hypothetical protein